MRCDFYAHNTNETVRTDSLIVHSPNLSEKGVSKHLSQFPISRGAWFLYCGLDKIRQICYDNYGRDYPTYFITHNYLYWVTRLVHIILFARRRLLCLVWCDMYEPFCFGILKTEYRYTKYVISDGGVVSRTSRMRNPPRPQKSERTRYSQTCT